MLCRGGQGQLCIASQSLLKALFISVIRGASSSVSSLKGLLTFCPEWGSHWDCWLLLLTCDSSHNLYWSHQFNNVSSIPNVSFSITVHLLCFPYLLGHESGKHSWLLLQEPLQHVQGAVPSGGNILYELVCRCKLILKVLIVYVYICEGWAMMWIFWCILTHF